MIKYPTLSNNVEWAYVIPLIFLNREEGWWAKKSLMFFPV